MSARNARLCTQTGPHRISCGVFALLMLGFGSGGAFAGSPRLEDLNAPSSISKADEARLREKFGASGNDWAVRHMSSMGRLAAQLAKPKSGSALLPGFAESLVFGAPTGDNRVVHGTGDPGYQSGATIAANSDASVLVAGYNDARGFDVTPATVSGIARSTDGGATWNEVPVGPGGLGLLPSVTNGAVAGNPDVKFDAVNNRFIYSSLFIRPSDGRQGVCIHVSNAGGSAWTGPTQATPTFSSTGQADKPFLDVNPVTGRIMITWTRFPNSGAVPEIRQTFSDNGGSSWAAALTLVSATTTLLQDSIPRFDPGTTNANSRAYCAYSTTATNGQHTIGFVRSTDGGASWGTPFHATTAFAFEDSLPGVDHPNAAPGLAVNHTSGQVYIVYQRNNASGVGDIAFQRSTDNGQTFSNPLLIDSNPGGDRAQFDPWVTVDQSSGRIHVCWYDQDADASGDRIEVLHSMSADNGATWSPPVPLSDRPFHAGHGNDQTQPNLGDYNQAVALNGKLHATTAITLPEPGFDGGQPTSPYLIPPDTYYIGRTVAQLTGPALRLGQVSVVESGCIAASNALFDPGETATIDIPLENYNQNASAGASTATSVFANLVSFTTGASLVQSISAYPNIAAGATQTNSSPFQLALAPWFVPGTPVELVLSVSTAQGSRDLPILLPTGSPGTTTILLSQNFNASSSLPSGWSSVHAGGSPTVNWVVNSSFTGSRAAFHTENASARSERLFSPSVVVPTPPAGVKSRLLLDFDITYNLEDEPLRSVLAYDGLMLRIADLTPGQNQRSVLAEAFAESILTGSIMHYPKHLPVILNSAYLDDMSVWSGNSNGQKHVAMVFPGDGMAGRTIQLRFDYTEDTVNDCPNGTCGVAVDNIVLKQVQTTAAPCETQNAARSWQAYGH